ncbi:MAG: porin [Betaproteobacteria bacterium]|nr:porin [Betaproteobacteria bacterium]
MFHKNDLVTFLGILVLAATQCLPAEAANWFKIQGISNPAWGRGKVLGWLEPDYSTIDGSNVNVNGHSYPIKPNLIGPEFSNSSKLTMQRARLMLRGELNPDISYFLAGEFGDNGYNYSNGQYSPQVIDAHMTFSNDIPGARIQAGIIHAPGPEGAMQGYMGYNFIDVFPSVIGQLMQPNFYSKNTKYNYNPASGGYLVPGSDLSSVNGFRYPGIQALDWFDLRKNLELAYGAMLGSYGNQFESNSSNGPIVAGRLPLSYLYGGGGSFFRNDLTGFVWAQQARPQLNGISNTMRREGFGVTYRQGYMETGARSLKAEYMAGTGNIAAPAPFNQEPGLVPAQYQTTFFPGSNNKASGYYVSVGYFVAPKVELNARYDYYDRLPNIPAQERVFTNIGIGAQYHITPVTRIVADYFIRKTDIPNPGAIGQPGSPQLVQATSIAHATGNEFDIYAIYAF